MIHLDDSPEAVESRKTVERMALAIVISATVWYALALGFCLFARVGNGHDALTASRGIMGDNMVQWGIWGPVREYTLERPGSELYYTHHPFGTYWVVGILARIFGRHEFVPRLAPVLMSVSIPGLLYGIGKRLWHPVCGALAAMAYTVVPITLAFGNLAGFEVPTVWACIVTTYGYVRFAEDYRRRWMAVSLLGAAWGINVDWNVVLFLGFVTGALGLAALFLPRRYFGRIDLRRFAQWEVLAIVIALLGVLGWLAYLAKIHAVDGLLQSEVKRTRGADVPYQEAIAARRYWIDVTFTPLAVVIGKIALPVFALRVVFWRKWNEVFILGIWFMALATYLGFKNGADVHIYWPFAFGTYFALSVGVVTATGMALAERILAWRKRADTKGAIPLLALGVMSLVPFLMLPDGIEGLRYARQTGGRFNEKGARDFRDVDKAQALEWMGQRMADGTVVEMHDGMHSTWANDWALHHRTKDFRAPPNKDAPEVERYFVADLQFQPTSDQKQMADQFKVVVVDHFVMVDRQAAKAPADAYVFDVREPTWLEWYTAYGTEPVRTIRPDAWATWEVRDAWGQSPNPPPAGEPTTREQIRIAHNVALARGDRAAAEGLEKRLVAELDVTAHGSFDDGTELLGQRYTPGVLPVLEVYFRAAGTSANDFEFAIHSFIDRGKLMSLVPHDDKVKQLGAPFMLPPKLWKVGYIYAEQAQIHHRAGVEHFEGHMEAGKDIKPPKLLGKFSDIGLLTIQ